MDNIILQKTWVQGGPVVVDNLLGTAFTGEAGAHTFLIRGVDSSQATIPITGTITANFLAANNVTIALSGSVSDGVASVTLDSNCYDVPGRFILSIYATNSSVTKCLYCAVGNIFRTQSSTIAYPTTELPNITSLMADLQDILDGWPADYTQIQTAVTTLQSDVSDLKSASTLQAENIPDTVQTITFDSEGNVQTITHTRDNVAVRTDAFTFAESTITEVRTLSTGESLTIVTNITTLQTTVTYAAA